MKNLGTCGLIVRRSVMHVNSSLVSQVVLARTVDCLDGGSRYGGLDGSRCLDGGTRYRYKLNMSSLGNVLCNYTVNDMSLMPVAFMWKGKKPMACGSSTFIFSLLVHLSSE